MSKEKFNYQELVDLGFKREDYTDNVYFRQYGNHPFHLSKKLSKRIELSYDCEHGTVEAIRLDKEDYKILGRMTIHSLHDIKTLIKFFEKK